MKVNKLKIPLYALVGIALLLGGVIIGQSLTSASTFWISSGVYPGAPSYTIWGEPTSAPTMYFAKNAYGAIDYSGTNASAVIQAALGALTAGRTWKEKVVLKGNFEVNNPLILPSFTTFEVNGKILMSASTSKNIIELANIATDVDIIGGVFDGNKANQIDGGSDLLQNGLYLCNGVNRRITVKDVTVQNAYYNGIVASGYDFTLINPIIQNNNVATNTYGLHCSSLFNSRILGGSVMNNKGGIFLYLTSGVQIFGARIESNTGNGVEFAYYAFLNGLNENTITFNGQAGIDLAHGFGNSITNNMIGSNEERGIAVHTGGAYKNIIKANTIFCNGEKLANTYDGIEIYQSIGNIIQNNIIYDDHTPKTQRYGISEVYLSDYNTIMGNDVRDNLAAIRFVGANSKISYNIGFVTENKGNSTGTGTQQTIAHNFNDDLIPNNVSVIPTETGATVTDVWADATNIYCTVTSGKAFKWSASLI